MSLDAFGGVLVNSPGELCVQPLLASPSNYATQTAFIPGPPTEITLDEDDAFQCGKCKKVFTSFQLFMFHKKEHQLSSSGSKFFGTGLSLALDGGLDGNIDLVDQGACLHDAGAAQLVQNQCCQELPLSEQIKDCLDTSSPVSSDVLEYGTLGETGFDDLHSDISQPMMLGDSDSLSFNIEQNALNISSSDQLPETEFVPSSMADIQSNILPDKLIEHEDCETSCDHVWNIAHKDDSSSLNFPSSSFDEEQPLFMDSKKFSVTNVKKMSRNIGYSNVDLLPEIAYSSDKEVFINSSATINVQEVMTESESDGILPSGEFFSKTSMDYMSSSDLLTEFEKVGRHALVNNGMVQPVTVLEVEMPLLSSAQLQPSLIGSAVLHSDIPALIPIGEHAIEDENNPLKRDILQDNISSIVIQKSCSASEPSIKQESVLSPGDVASEEVLLPGETTTKQIISLLKENNINNLRREVDKNFAKSYSEEKNSKKRESAIKVRKYSTKSLNEVCELTVPPSDLPVNIQSLCRKERTCSSNLKDMEVLVKKPKPASNSFKKSKGAKNSKNRKSSKVSSVIPLLSNPGVLSASPNSVTSVAFSLEAVQSPSGGTKREKQIGSGTKKKSKESSWEPRALKLTCGFCEKKFAKQFDLQQHLRSHTGEKPFQCIVCGRAFAQKSNVTKHIRTHKVWPKSVLTLPKNFLQKVESKNKTGLGEDSGVGKQKNKSGGDLFRGQRNNDTDLKSLIDDDLLNSTSTDNQLSKLRKEKKKDVCEEKPEEYIIDNSYICQFCDSSFSTYFELKNHLKVHQDEKVYVCNQKGCKQTFPDLTSFVDHIQMHDSQEATYRCHVCKQTFKSLTDLGTHQYTHSSCDKSTSKRSAFKCLICRSRFVSPEALDHHMKTAIHKHPCPECKREFTCERNLRRHLTAHSTACPFVCKECGKSFKTEGYLNVHLTMHSKDKPFTCSHCPARFARKDRLSRHFLIHQESKRMKCPFHIHLNCHRFFTRKDKLKAHVFSHTDHKHLNCITCKQELLNFSRNKTQQKAAWLDADSEQSSSEESRGSRPKYLPRKNINEAITETCHDEGSVAGSFQGDNLEDVIRATIQTCQHEGQVIRCVKEDRLEDMIEASIGTCEDDGPVGSPCFLSSVNLPTIEIIVMPMPVSIS